jgi:hypothetical protein
MTSVDDDKWITVDYDAPDDKRKKDILENIKNATRPGRLNWWFNHALERDIDGEILERGREKVYSLGDSLDDKQVKIDFLDMLYKYPYYYKIWEPYINKDYKKEECAENCVKKCDPKKETQECARLCDQECINNIPSIKIIRETRGILGGGRRKRKRSTRHKKRRGKKTRKYRRKY